MRSVILAALHGVRASLRTRVDLQLEIVALRHQVGVLERTRPTRGRLTECDRLFWVVLTHFWAGWRTTLMIVQPATVIAWHRRAFRCFWTWKSRRKQGRPGTQAELRALIHTMAGANPTWGAPRIHGELLKLGFTISQATVSRLLPITRRPPSQTWRTFLANHASQIIAADFFVVPTVTFRLLFVLIILSHERRRLVHIAVTAHPTAAWTAQQLREAFPHDDAPRFLLHDRDAAFAAVGATAEGMGIQEVRTAPRSPWQNPYAERVIGSIRRECLDHVLVCNERGLRRVLRQYAAYYHETRTHLSLGKDAPLTRPVAARGRIIAVPQVGGLHHRYDRLAA
jgi:putative transposase